MNIFEQTYFSPILCSSDKINEFCYEEYACLVCDYSFNPDLDERLQIGL